MVDSITKLLSIGSTALSQEFDFIFTADPEPIADRLPAAAGLLLQGRSAAS
eukprot:COSAG01_NODE_73417_length_246_cov_1.666667_1_plen_50_part_10